MHYSHVLSLHTIPLDKKPHQTLFQKRMVFLPNDLFVLWSLFGSQFFLLLQLSLCYIIFAFLFIFFSVFWSFNLLSPNDTKHLQWIECYIIINYKLLKYLERSGMLKLNGPYFEKYYVDTNIHWMWVCQMRAQPSTNKTSESFKT